MMEIKAKTQDIVAGSLITAKGVHESLNATGKYVVECYDKDKNLKWVAESKNLVVNVGLQYMAGVALTSTAQITSWYVGLYGAGASNTPAASDTMSSHAGWTENTNYSPSGRKALVMGTATTADPSVINNSSSTAVFTMTSNAQVIAGAFVTTVNTGGTSPGAKLFSEGNFTGGDKTVDSGDTLTVTYEFSLNPA